MGSASRSLLVARESELATLQRCLDAARERAPRVALVEGEAGIGKSTLVRLFIEEAGGDCLVVRASGDERESALAYGIVGQLVDQMPAAPMRETPGLRGGPMPGADPLVIGTELAASLGAVSRSRCTVVVVEDLHWADVASYEALVSAARRLRAVRTLIVASYRPDELAHFGGRWERFASTDERCTRIRLSGLRADAVRTLARQLRSVDVPRPVADRIVEHTAADERACAHRAGTLAAAPRAPSLLGTCGLHRTLATCGARAPSAAGQTTAAAHTASSAYCAQILGFKPRASMPFDEEAPIIRAAAPAAPASLRSEVAVVLAAYEQIQDSDSGVISADQVTVPQTATFQQAMSDIDQYTAEHCGVHVAQRLPVLPGN